MLGEIAYEPWLKRDGTPGLHNPIIKEVATYMANEDWVKLTGLSYSETMKLPYSEWIILQNALIARGLPKEPSETE